MTSIVRSPSLAVAFILLTTFAARDAWTEREQRPGANEQAPLPFAEPAAPQADYCPSGCGDAEADGIIKIAAKYTQQGNPQAAVDYLERCSHICKKPVLICALATIYYDWKGTSVEDIAALLRMSQQCLTEQIKRIDVNERERIQRIHNEAEVEFDKRTADRHRRYRTIGTALMISGSVTLAAGLASAIALSFTAPEITYTSFGSTCTSASGIPGDPCILDRRLPIGVVLCGVGAPTLTSGLVLYFKYPQKKSLR